MLMILFAAFLLVGILYFGLSLLRMAIAFFDIVAATSIYLAGAMIWVMWEFLKLIWRTGVLLCRATERYAPPAGRVVWYGVVRSSEALKRAYVAAERRARGA